MDSIRLLWTVYFVTIGLCIGSFSLATAWRIHKKRSFGKDRSECEHCKHKLAAKDLVPLFSWISTGGRCRYCQKKLSAMFPLAELAGGLVFGLSFVAWPLGLDTPLHVVQFILWLLALAPLLILFFYDLQWFILPTKIIQPLWAISFVYATLVLIQSPTWVTLASIVTSVLISRGLFWLFWAVSKGSWIGFGDVRLGLAIGLLLATPAKAAIALFVASITGILITLPSLLTGSRKMNTKVPFGPLLIIGLIFSMLYGQPLVDAYMRAVGL